MNTFVVAIAFAACVAAASLEAQQPPRVENAKLESRAFAGTLAAQISGFGAGPFWTAWQEPIIPGRRGDMCWNGGNGDDAYNDAHAVGAPVRLEGPVAVVVLARIETRSSASFALLHQTAGLTEAPCPSTGSRACRPGKASHG
jgi:hypothetical protein